MILIPHGLLYIETSFGRNFSLLFPHNHPLTFNLSLSKNLSAYFYAGLFKPLLLLENHIDCKSVIRSNMVPHILHCPVVGRSSG